MPVKAHDKRTLRLTAPSNAGMRVCLAIVIGCLAVSVAGSGAGGTQQQIDFPPRGQPAPALVLQHGAMLRGRDGPNATLKAALWERGLSEPFSSFVHISRQEAAHNSSSISKALVFTAYQLSRQGFNAVLLPFSFSDLRPSSSRSTSSPSQQCTQVPLGARIGASTATQAESGAAAGGSNTQLAQLLQQWQTGSTTQQPCLSLLPGTSTLDRFLWSVQWFVSNGLYVILSGGGPGGSNGSCSHTAASSSNGSGSGGGSSSGSNGCVEDASASAEAWGWLWKAVAALPDFKETVSGRVMLQLAQDAAAAGQRWEPTTSSSGQHQPGLQEQYLAIMDAVDAAAPGSALFVLPGPQQPAAAGTGANQWGNGFNAAPALLNAGLTDPTGLFRALIDKPYKNQVILAPQVHPPQPTNATNTGSSSSGDSSTHTAAAAATAAAEVPNSADVGAAAVDDVAGAVRQGSSSPVKLLDTSFQQLSHVGFCVAEGNCLRAPVLVTQQQQQQQGPVHKGGQQQAALAQQEDFQRFAEFVLGAQAGSASNHQDGDAATGNWYRWDMSQQAGGAAPSIGQKHSAGVKPDSQQAARSSSKDAPGDVEPHAKHQQGQQQMHDGIMTFVYSADDTDRGSIKVFDTQDAA